jgi:2'-5' RNA ligase
MHAGGSLGFFDRAGIFFAGVSLTPELEANFRRASPLRLRQCGFIPETRPYHPHITLARTKRKKASRRCVN